MPAPDPSWEGRHPSHREFWSFDFCAPDAGLGGFIGLTLHPRPQSGAWYWAALVGAGRPYLLVRDLEIEAPRRPGSREIRADGLWADVNCETPFDHWSLGLEAFGVAMDDPDEALGAERGDRIGLGLDLEWEAVAGISGKEGDYAQPCDVHGEILVGAGSAVETIAFEGHGGRRHTWWPGAPWLPLPGDRPAGQAGEAGPSDRPAGERLWGRLDDGTPYMSPGGAVRPGYGRLRVVDHGATDAAPPAEPDVSHRQAAATATEADASSATEPRLDRHVLFRAPLRLGAGQVLERSLCRFTVPHPGTGTGTGTGIGWHEQVEPAP